MKKHFALLIFTVCLATGFVAAQTAPADETLIFLVRHAEKDLTESSPDPSLSAVGKAQAERLAAMLKNAGIQAVYSTATKRTEQTAQPLAQLLGLAVQHYEATEADLPAKLATRSQGKRVLVVSHSNLLPKILNAYTQSEKYTVSDDYGDLFLLRLAGRQPASVVRLRF